MTGCESRDIDKKETPEFVGGAARAVLSLGFSESQKSQMVKLADKHNRGQLSAAEQEQLKSYRRVGSCLALLHSRARLSLQQAGHTAR